MASTLTRCTSGTDIPADARAGWPQPQLSRVDNEIRVTAPGVASVEHGDDRDRGADPSRPNAARTRGRAAAVRFLDAIDRARLTPMDVLLVLHVAEADATVVDLANQLDRRAADVRRATGRLVARGLLRRRADRTDPWGLVFTATASGLELLAVLEAPPSLERARYGDVEGLRLDAERPSGVTPDGHVLALGAE